jgi:hypothetical protein
MNYYSKYIKYKTKYLKIKKNFKLYYAIIDVTDLLHKNELNYNLYLSNFYTFDLFEIKKYLVKHLVNEDLTYIY